MAGDAVGAPGLTEAQLLEIRRRQRDSDLVDGAAFAGVIFFLALVVGATCYLVRAALWLVTP